MTETISIARDPRVASAKSSAKMQWKQLWSLAALYGSVIIGWIAYENYQPRLLVQFRFTDFAFLLTMAQGIIIVLTPLIAGRIGDRFRAEKGHRIPIISSGISFAAMIFMAVAFTLLSNPGDLLRWMLPVLIVCWLVAMSVFTSPALSTMELFAPIDRLPNAMAILTITGNLVYSLEPVIVDIIDLIGAPLTFIAGGVAVFLSGYALKKNSLDLFRRNAAQEPVTAHSSAQRSSYAQILFLGISLGIATSLLFNFVPDVMALQLGIADVDGNVLAAGILLFSALISWPMSLAVNRYGMVRMFLISIVALSISSITLFSSTTAGLVLASSLIFSFAFTSLSVSSLPLAIHRAALREKVFCVGLFFSGVALPEALVEGWKAWATAF